MTWADIVEAEEQQQSNPSSKPRVPEPVTMIPMYVGKIPSNPPSSPSSHPEDVTKYITDNIALSDSIGSLRLYHYLQCDETSDDMTKQTRGIVRRGDKIVCKTFGFTSEFSSNQGTEIQNKMKNVSFQSCKFFDSVEGAMVRLFYDENRWYLTTHRRLDAFRSKWGIHTNSFGDLFVSAIKWESQYGCLRGIIPSSEDDLQMLDTYCNLLQRNKTYTFLVCNDSLNRIVCDAPAHPTVYFSGSFDHTTHLLVEGNDSGIPFPPSHSFSSLQDVLSFVDTCNWKNIQGITVYMPNQTQMKITSPTYLKYFEIRGNEPSIKFRYLQIRNHADKVKMFLELYPEHSQTITNYETYLLYIARMISQAYTIRFQQKHFVRIPPEQYRVMCSCMEIVASKAPDRLISDMAPISILLYMNKQLSATHLNHLIKTVLPVVSPFSSQDM